MQVAGTSHLLSEKSALEKENGAESTVASGRSPELEVGLLTGGHDKPYAFGLAMALASKDVAMDVIGGDAVDSPELHTTPGISFLNLQGNKRPDASLAKKVTRVLVYYARLIRYAAIAKPKIFHILWNNKFEFFDRTLLLLYYRIHGKRIVLTVHNVNAGKRDSHDSLLNRLTLKIQYRLAKHIFVHTEKMKRELIKDFAVPERSITVIPFGINNAVPETELTPRQARRRLGIAEGERTMLFFGSIRPYKGLEYLVAAFQQMVSKNPIYRLIIAGQPIRGTERYADEIQRTISGDSNRERVIQKIEYVPDEETELYFKAADVLVLPYTEVFQSGVLFLGYRFGLPVVAADVGSLREDIIEGRTGFVCRPSDPVDLAKTIERYFESDLCKDLSYRRQEIRDFASAEHSWEVVGEMTRKVYSMLLAEDPS